MIRVKRVNMESERALGKLKWTSIPNDDVARTVRDRWKASGENGKPAAKPIVGKKENDLRQIGKIREKRRGR